MGISVEMELGCLDDLLSDATGYAAADALAERMRADMHPYVPKDSGTMADTAVSSVLAPGEGEVAYVQPYSVFPYTADDGATDWSTSGTHSHWDEYAKAEHIGDWEETALAMLIGGAL